MDELWTHLIDNMVRRITGPMHFRVFLQPLMATILALIAGRADAKAGKPPYVWALLIDAQHRADMLKDGWKDVSKVFVLAIVLDVVYQYIEQKFVYPGEAVIVAFLLAIVPYLIVRGLVTRLTRP